MPYEGFHKCHNQFLVQLSAWDLFDVGLQYEQVQTSGLRGQVPEEEAELEEDAEDGEEDRALREWAKSPKGKLERYRAWSGADL